MSAEYTGVNYTNLDGMKRQAQQAAVSTDTNAAEFATVGRSRGESAFVWEEEDAYRASVIEGLGTKHLVADAMEELTGTTYYDEIAQDAVAAIVNDLVVVGAEPQVLMAYWAVGDGNWFGNARRNSALVEGWKNACNKAGVVWGGGETPALQGVLHANVIDLGGSAQGIIKPKERLTLGEKLQEGDAILLVESNGIHANGLTRARQIAENLPEGYLTKMDDGRTYGQALLSPSHIYAKLVQTIFDKGVDLHYMVNITGHGWRKLMRSSKEFTYMIDTIPQPQEEFNFIQNNSGMTDEEMYGTFNMGAGFALFVPQEDIEKVLQAGQAHGLKILQAGKVVEGEKQVVIQPKGITFEQDSLQVR